MNPKDLVGAKKAPLRYVPVALMIEASGPMEDGALKYGPFNWREKPVEVVTYVEAALRHLFAFLDGQDNAEDSGHSHIGHAIAGLGIIADARANGTLIDNRFLPGPAADMLRERDKSAPSFGTFSDDPDMQRGLECEVVLLSCEHGDMNGSITEEPWGVGGGAIYGMGPDAWRAYGSGQVEVSHRGEWPPDTRVDGRLTCCGQSDHTLTCPQYR